MFGVETDYRDWDLVKISKPLPDHFSGIKDLSQCRCPKQNRTRG